MGNPQLHLKEGRDIMKYLKNYSSLVEVIEDRVKDNKGITFISSERDFYMSYKDLYNTALSILSDFQAKGIKEGDEIIFQLLNPKDFICTFWACLLGGILPVPLPLSRNVEHKKMVMKVWYQLRNPYLITSEGILSKLAAGDDNKSLQSLMSRILLIERVGQKVNCGKIHYSKQDDIAFIQFSSGSTGDPKGVILTHENLLNNMNAMLEGIDATDKDSTLSWVPLTHDLGLIGFHITPILANIDQYIMGTEVFLTNPVLWLEKAQEYKVTLLSSPNFGYKHFLNYFDPTKAAHWDLSHVRLICNGAEPISAQLSNAFYNLMANFGLKSSAAVPGYGLAEATLVVSLPPLGEGLVSIDIDRDYTSIGDKIKEGKDLPIDKKVTFVDLGYPVSDCVIRICDKENKVLSDGNIGRVQLKGKGVSSGYYNNKEITKKAFTEDGWLKTGDLGFLNNGRLIITGREKDIIFINGQNFYPYDIERIALSVKELGNIQVAACGVLDKDTQREDVVVFVQFEEEVEAFIPIAQKLKVYMNKLTGLDIKYIVPVMNIPRTSGGKIQRYKMKQMFENGSFSNVVATMNKLSQHEIKKKKVEPPTNDTEKKLLEIWSNVLESTNIGITDSYFELGGNSLKATYIVNSIHKVFNVEIPLRVVFERNTIKDLANYIDKIDSIQRFEPIEKMPKKDSYDVSPAQKRIYVLEQLNEKNTTYNISQALLIEGNLCKEKIEETLNRLINRHESLRTSFVMIDGQPMQKIHEDISIKIAYKELGEEDIEKEIGKLIMPFNLSEAPLLRAGLIKIKENENVFVMDIHHIIADGTSMNILLKEFITLYQDEELPLLNIQYKDFAFWQKKSIYDAKLENQKKYWINEFSNEVPDLSIPTDYSRPRYQSFEGDKLSFSIDSNLTDKLKKLASIKQTSLYMVLVSAYYLLLSKYSGKEDIVVGTPIAGRTHLQVKNVIGMFVNTLALRNYPKGEKSFEEFLHEVKNRTLEAYDNQEYPFEMLVEELNIPRDMSRNPLFDAMFVFQNMEKVQGSISDLNIYSYSFHSKRAKFDITLFAEEINNYLSFELEYCTKLFNEHSMERLTKYFANILEQIVEAPHLKLCDIQMISEEEKRKLLLSQFNDARQESKSIENKTVIQLFEETVEKNPHKTAISSDNQQITYEDLNQKASKLAWHLKKLEIDSGEAIGIIAEPSIELIISILAVMKVGGIYVPIEPSLPKDRMDYMLEHSQAKLVLSTNKLVKKINFDGIYVDVSDEKIYEVDSYDIAVATRLEDPVYIMFTSGSTGKPKGVIVKNQGLSNYIQWASKTYVKDEVVAFPLFTSISFDLTVTSIFTPLITGNRIIVYKSEENEAIIKEILKDDKVQIIKLTPSHLRLIMDVDNSQSSIKKLIVGGEQLDTKLVKDIYNSFYGNIEIFNEYGPTEATVGCMIHRFDYNKDLRPSVPIGTAIENLSIHVLDKYLNPVPVNVPGEIYIGGVGVAKGYLKNETLTTEKFIPNPSVKGETLYRTGDLARWLPDNKLEFIGRVDSQVKIRGFRIEIGEIEGALLDNESIKQAVVIDKENERGEKYLTAFFTSDISMNPIDMRKYLALKLPEYMIPSFFIQLDEMPLNNNGKVNMKALSHMEVEINTGMEYVAATTDLEKKLTDVWVSVLDVDKIGIHDNFFVLGGDSIKAVQIVSRLNEMDIDIKVKDILTYQTISEICVTADFSKEKRQYEQGYAEGEIPLPPIYQWFIDKELNNIDHYNQSVLLELNKNINEDNLQIAMNKIIEHHDGLRVNYSSKNSKLFYNSKHLNKGFEIEVYDISDVDMNIQKSRIEEIGLNLKSSFNIEDDLLIKVALIYADSKQYLLITAHHFVIDGISWRILLNDLFNILVALEKNKEFKLSKKTASMKLWYEELRNYLEKDVEDGEKNIWRNLYQEEFTIPQDFEDGDQSLEYLETMSGVLNEEETKSLLTLCHKAYNTEINDILLAALALTINKWTDNKEILVELESHGRHLDDIDVTRTVGWFTSIYPVKLTLSNESLSKDIMSIKEQLRDIPNNGLGYGLVKYLDDNEEYKDNDNTQLRFNYLGQFGKESENELFRFSDQFTGNEICKSNRLTAKIEINSIIVNGIFKATFSYSNKCYRTETVERLANLYTQNLRRIIEHTVSKEETYFTPSDFETTDMVQEDLDKLFS